MGGMDAKDRIIEEQRVLIEQLRREIEELKLALAKATKDSSNSSKSPSSDIVKPPKRDAQGKAGGKKRKRGGQRGHKRMGVVVYCNKRYSNGRHSDSTVPGYYREDDILARVGFSIHRSTQWRWMRSLAGVVLPLVKFMRQGVMQSHVQGIDETPCPLLCPERGHTRNAYLYAQYGDNAHPYVCFSFAAHKNEENVRCIVGNYEGYLQSDAYICYELIAAAAAGRIIAVGCWAHARRKFEPLIQSGSHPRATWILGEVQKLYDIEDRAREMTDEERLALRQAESRPIVAGIKAWLDERDQKETPRSPLRSGVSYLLTRWESFERFPQDGAIPIDNNRTEGMIKGPVMGKKAWLFLGNESGGETAAVLYTLTMTCKRHAIDVQAYLTDVFRLIRTATPAELEEFLPDRWIEAHPEARVIQRVQESPAAAARKRQRRIRRRLAVPSG